jgi:hypothetical protein
MMVTPPQAPPVNLSISDDPSVFYPASWARVLALPEKIGGSAANLVITG